jgi:hypothetical protein
MKQLSAMAVALTLAGCGGMADTDTTHHLGIHTGRAAQTLTVAIRPYADGSHHSPQTLVTDSHGDAQADFRTLWGSVFLIIPPIGSIPRRPPKPDYLITYRRKTMVVSPTSPATTYRWQSGAWRTETTIALP